MSEELNNLKQLLNAYKLTYASKKGFSNPIKWYPRTAKDIDNLLKSFVKDFSDSKKFEKELKDFLDSSYAQVIENDLVLIAKKGDHKDWLTEERKVWKNANSTNSQFAFYKSKAAIHLGNGFDEMDKSTDQILSLLEDPKRTSKWMTRGMVVGDVQSGKTSHYTGLITKAIDSGYKLIIILSGIFNSLRAQTQKRIQENTIMTGQLGELNKIFFATGTPEYKWEEGIRKVYKENDFNTTIASAISITNKDPLVMVVKKNVSILSSILIWYSSEWISQISDVIGRWMEQGSARSLHPSMIPTHI